MPSSSPALVGIGNALLDVLSHVDDPFFIQHASAYGVEKGTMALIDADQATLLYNALPAPIQAAGGSAANTLAGFSAFGGHAAFIGKTAHDTVGDTFTEEMHKHGIAFSTPRLKGVDTPSGRCMIMITPDAERTMSTFLGASTELGAADISADVIGQAYITYLEGYLFDKDTAKSAFFEAARHAKNAGRTLALSLSDPFCVHRHRADFLTLLSEIDILFANEEEIKALYETDSFEDAVAKVSAVTSLAIVTRGAQGAEIYHADDAQPIHIPAVTTVGPVIDTTGAGDQFAAGVLFGLTRGLSLDVSGALGALAAAEVISHTGPRPHTDLYALAVTYGLLPPLDRSAKG